MRAKTWYDGTRGIQLARTTDRTTCKRPRKLNNGTQTSLHKTSPVIKPLTSAVNYSA